MLSSSRYQFFFVVVFLTILVAQSTEIDLKCYFEQVENQYRCVIENCILSEEGVSIRSVIGNHFRDKSKDDVLLVMAPHGGQNSIVHLFFGIGKIFTNLKTLMISHSELRFIKRRNFIELENLQRLILIANYIEFIPEDAFNDLENLLELDLDLNRIKELQPNLLSKLVNLRNFNADENFFENLPENFFAKNPINFIGIRKGNLRSIEVDFTQLLNVSCIILQGHPCVNETFNLINPHMSIEKFQKILNKNC